VSADGRWPYGTRLRLRRNPLRLALSASPWRSAWYLASYLVIGAVLFCVAFTTVTTPGVIAQATTSWRDRATWRDLAYLVGLWVR
jgi:hypothetical protein